MDFHQNGAVTTLHNLGLLPLEQLEKKLKLFSGYRPMELVLPSLYSEIEGPALPKIVEELSRVNYLSHITIGLDRATRAEFDKAKNFFSKLNIPHPADPAIAGCTIASPDKNSGQAFLKAAITLHGYDLLTG